MSAPRILILCGRSARHLYVANALCRAAEPLAIVQETGSDWNLRKTLRKLRPDNLARKVWRWVRDRRRYTGNPEAKFFFRKVARGWIVRIWCTKSRTSTTPTWSVWPGNCGPT
jgi:methionyl-tRNA formyltransferase